MNSEVDLLRGYERHVIECLDIAIECGLDTDPGRDAFHLAMQCLSTATDLKAQLIYEPLADDPATRDYILRLDDHRYELMEGIDILRAYIELTMDETAADETSADETSADEAQPRENLSPSLNRLRRRLLVLFKREAPLGPVFEAWQERRDTMDSPQPGRIVSPSVAIH